MKQSEQKHADLRKLLLAALLLLAAVVSIFPVADWMTEPKTYAATIASIDEKSDTVLKLTAASTLASAGISAIPGDAATPIAEKLADFTEYFLIVLCVLFAEKYLLVIIGAGMFKILIPIVCLLLLVSLFRNPKLLRRLAFKMAVIGLFICITIPLSIRVSDMIYEAYRISIDETISSAEQLTEETSELAEAEDESILRSILNRLSESVTSLSDRAARILNRFVESLAVLIVTSCVIPLLVLVFFLWLIKIVTGLKIPAHSLLHLRGHKKKNGPLPDENALSESH